MCAVISLMFSLSSFAQESTSKQEPSSAISYDSDALIDGGVINARTKIIENIDPGQGITYTIYTPPTFDIYVDLEAQCFNWVMEIDDDYGVVMSKRFYNQPTHVVYQDKSGYWAYGKTKLIIFNDSSWDGSFYGTIDFLPH